MDSPFWWSTSTGDVRVAFTSVSAGNLSRNHGQSALENRRSLEQQIGAAPGSLRFLHQTHSDTIADADSATAIPRADGWVSKRGSPLAVLVADCLPVLFAATTAQGRLVTAAAHAGRAGLLAGVLSNAVEAMRSRGAEQITAWIGPGACGSCYELPQEMVQRLTADRPAMRSTTSWGTAALNLRAEAAQILQNLRVAVVDVPGCTIEDPRLFSHRRSQRTGEPEARSAGLILATR